ncbi:MAG: hypothetical protein ABIK52_03645, partial [Bacteroidota bacterium]
MRFSDIPADPAIKTKLIQTIRDQRVSHAQLFYGQEGSGKLALAIAYAQLINCTAPNTPKPPEGGLIPPLEGEGQGGVSPQGSKSPSGDLGVDSCGTCPSCIQYQKLAHPDLHFFFPVATSRQVPSKPSSRLYISEWREFLLDHNYQISLPEWFNFIRIENKQGTIYTEDANEINRILSYMSYESEYKVVILWMIEKLTYAAAPKLLKILEEPPDKTLFLLISENPDHVIPTILSRCLPVRIPRVPESEEDQSYFETFRKWMRLCFTGNVPEIIGFTNEIAKIGRENQKSLLQYGLQVASQSASLQQGITRKVTAGEEELDFVTRFSPTLFGERLP